MKNSVQIFKTDNKITVTDNECRDSRQLKSIFTFKYNAKRITGSNLNTIAVSSGIFNTLENSFLTLVNIENGRFTDVVPISDNNLSHNEIAVTNFVREQLSLDESSKIELCKNNINLFNNIMLQKIDNIKDDSLVISSKDACKLNNMISVSQYELFEIINITTQKSFIINRKHILIDTTLPAGSIRLNRKHRCLLESTLPLYLSDKLWSIIAKNNSPEQSESGSLLSFYNSESHTLNDNLSYIQKRTAADLFKKNCRPEICIKPVIESFNTKTKYKLTRKITDFFVGKSTMALACRRPYENDENSNVVRITKDNMSLLGIEEMDNVILNYKGKEVRCRALVLDNEKNFNNVNLPIQTSLAIGVPVHIRKSLGIPNVKSTVKISRDTSFIFKKSINEQIVPIILTLFSAQLFTDLSVIFSVLLTMLAIPIVVYINLSPKRNMRA